MLMSALNIDELTPQPSERHATRYCPHCGSCLVSRVPSGDSIARGICDGCGHIHYENPKILVACILCEDDKILWIKRATEPFAGRWAIPAGFMERGETVSETACRELYEETRLEITPERLSLYGVLSIPEMDQVYISLISSLPSRHYGRTAEALDIRLMNHAEAMRQALAYSPQTLHWIDRLYRALAAGEVPKPAVPLSMMLAHVRDARPG